MHTKNEPSYKILSKIKKIMRKYSYVLLIVMLQLNMPYQEN